MRDLVSILEEKNIFGILEYAAETYGDAPAITNCGEDQKDHSYSELLGDVKQMAIGLRSAGRASEDAPRHFVICGPNCYDWVVCFLAVIVAGDVIIPMDADIKECELARALTNVDATELITDRDFTDITLPKCSIAEFRKHWTEQGAVHEDGQEADLKDNGEQVSIFLMTSGVTSSPKFVCLSQKNVIYSTLNGMDAVPIEPGRRVLSVLPPHHSYEISCGLLYNICFGSHIYINDAKINTIQNVRKYCPQCMAAVPVLVNGLANLARMELQKPEHPWVDALKIIYCGGAAVSPKVVRYLKEQGILVLQGYGMTECSPAITFNRLNDPTEDTVGQPLRFVELKFGQDKEIFVKAPNVMKGYYKNSKATEAVLKDGWLATGDAGYLDDAGRLIICGRLKNVIVLSTGENVYPEELEEYIFQTDTRVQYCRVYEKEGMIIADLYSDYLSKAELIDIVAAVNEQVSDFKRIAEINILERMPEVTALGKAYRKEKEE